MPPPPNTFAWGERLPTLTGRRLKLRWLDPSDAPALFAIFGDPEVTRYWSSPPLREEAEAEALVQDIHRQFAARTLFQWGIARRADDEIIGTCTLWQLDPAHRRAEIGFALGRSFWRQGFMTEALGLLLAFAFDTLDLHRLEADVDPRNVASLRLLDRLGFRGEGLLRERYHVNGETQDALLLGLLRREWEGKVEG